MKVLYKIFIAAFLLIYLVPCVFSIPLEKELLSNESLIAELEKLSLPQKLITASDFAHAENTIQQALSLITLRLETIKKANKKKRKANLKYVPRNEKGHYKKSLFITGLFQFEDWLVKQDCVQKVYMPYVRASEKSTAAIILPTYPAQIPIMIGFYSHNSQVTQYRLRLFAGPASFRLAELTENSK